MSDIFIGQQQLILKALYTNFVLKQKEILYSFLVKNKNKHMYNEIYNRVWL